MLGYRVGDSALYTLTPLQAFKREQRLFVTRVPMQIKEAKELLFEAPYDKTVEIIEAIELLRVPLAMQALNKGGSHLQPSGLSKRIPYFSQALP
jgi:hypothetical protein